jgi:hypothetical protein
VGSFGSTSAQLSEQQSASRVQVFSLARQLAPAHCSAIVANPAQDVTAPRAAQVPLPVPSPHHSQLAAVHWPQVKKSPQVDDTGGGGSAPESRPDELDGVASPLHELNSQTSHVPSRGPSESPATHVPVDAQKPHPEPALVQSPHAVAPVQLAASGDRHAEDRAT